MVAVEPPEGATEHVPGELSAETAPLPLDAAQEPGWVLPDDDVLSPDDNLLAGAQAILLRQLETDRDRLLQELRELELEAKARKGDRRGFERQGAGRKGERREGLGDERDRRERGEAGTNELFRVLSTGTFSPSPPTLRRIRMRSEKPLE